jgi:methionine-rich copper-binding protein CopC
MRLISRPAVAAGVILLVLATAGLASAHSHYVSSTPGASATVASAPSSVTMMFDETVVAGTTASVTDAAGATVSTGAQIATSDPDRKTLTVALKSGLGNGVYKVSYLSVSDDGAKLQGSFAFGVNAPVPASLAKTETELSGDTDQAKPATGRLPRSGGPPLGPLAGAGGLLAALGALARRRA